jgi:hypothetical protein
MKYSYLESVHKVIILSSSGLTGHPEPVEKTGFPDQVGE